jgi:hypothetical protein
MSVMDYAGLGDVSSAQGVINVDNVAWDRWGGGGDCNHIIVNCRK